MEGKDPWIRPLRGAAAPRARVLFLPHAGGAASFYAPFAGWFPEGYDVTAVQYPGRQERFGEPFVTTVEGLADRLVPSLRRWAAQPVPLVLFGHSMGASVAFESVLRLGRDRLTEHCRLVVSGRTAPSVPRESPVPDSDREILDHLAALGGTDPEIVRDPDLMDLFLPVLRNDYRAIARYRADPGAVVDTPVLCLTGDRDPQVAPEGAAAWKNHTTAGFRLETLPGDHFFLTDDPGTVVRLVTECADAGGR
ncbi:thioesterase II family protein [Streptomyces prasinopilosus]|uniref:Surfactin synthase thioesterase subunit n=1 Tax=Streptomyces prasinopilosus TaxID=67344 RepID=A0A1G6ZI18_9ACTN|nr:alpha/beta fold hydrolase [Streptomyces prasinopilosus]SDE02170.1 Surfactin synthase thioesterase subunit [Streptomyces prasinopilosus]